MIIIVVIIVVVIVVVHIRVKKRHAVLGGRKYNESRAQRVRVQSTHLLIRREIER